MRLAWGRRRTFFLEVKVFTHLYRISPHHYPDRQLGWWMASFEKVGECLYRYVPTGTYYARFESSGREIRRSLDTDDRPLAKRRLADLQRSTARTVQGGGKVTLGQLCERYLATTRNQAHHDLPQRGHRTAHQSRLARRCRRAHWQGGHITHCGLAGQLQLRRAFIQSASRIHPRGVCTGRGRPVAGPFTGGGMKIKKRKKPIRKTPTLEEFRAIVADIRASSRNADAGQRGFRGVHRAGRAGAGGGRGVDLGRRGLAE